MSRLDQLRHSPQEQVYTETEQRFGNKLAEIVLKTCQEWEDERFIPYNAQKLMDLFIDFMRRYDERHHLPAKGLIEIEAASGLSYTTTMLEESDYEPTENAAASLQFQGVPMVYMYQFASDGPCSFRLRGSLDEAIDLRDWSEPKAEEKQRIEANMQKLCTAFMAHLLKQTPEINEKDFEEDQPKYSYGPYF